MKKKHAAVSAILSSALVLGSFSVSDAVVISESPGSNSVKTGKVWNENANVPIFVKEEFAEMHPSSNAENAMDYLEENEQEIGIKNAEENLKVSDVQEDDLGMTQVRFNQTKNGVPVEGTEVIVHFNENEELVTVNGNYNPEAEKTSINTDPTLDEEDAIKAASSAVDAPQNMKYDPISELVIYPFEEEKLLAYKVNVTFMGETPGNWFVYVDAKNGNVIDRYNTIAHIEEGEFHKSVGTGVHGDHRELHTTRVKPPQQGTNFILADSSHEGLEGIYTFDSNTDEIAVNNSASWKKEYHHPAVDAHYNSEKVYDYFLNEHDRNSLDDEGMAIISYVNYGTDFNNAFWNGRHMTYGNGDGDYMVPLSAGLDVAAHEMAHGVITNTANLEYRFESGALNEAFADIFGALVDEDNWEIGEDIMGPGAIADGRTSLRSLSDPSKYPVNEEYIPYGDGEGMYPSHMDEFYDLPMHLDNGGVHINSSIINHAAYITGEQIGKEKLGQIYYRALVTYLTPTSDFSDARLYIIQSAEDIYGEGSEEARATADGFDQVGIYE
ncbi:Zn-dependent metalloprotease [Virgibacillus natechei]|uniref:Neutral metalloproteinase n=1 Tax=Virgibacillus natechei TaxID=1216297 RepID=A0ABS4IGA2_9BACI|nr:M4 family metallopeptidase [Virgibacillus natechei]MBP1969963.1 Zn-dependent metalloprotease [Virgibacillus natechei]UZD13377.1 M4 family metallopeptidase [Virgibacillus natechei]